MRRVVLTVLATLAAVLAAPVPPAAAAEMVIDRLSQLSAPYSLSTTTCAGANSTTADIRLESGPFRFPMPEDPGDSPPLGNGSLELDTPSSDDRAGIERTVDQLADLETFDLWVHDFEGRTEAVIFVYVIGGFHDDGTPIYDQWTGRTGLGSGSNWFHVSDLMTRTWVWTAPPGVGEPIPFLYTIDEFLTANGSGPATIGVQRRRCGESEPATSTSHVDALTITATGEVATTFDFEEPPVDITISADPTSISAGGSTTVRGELETDGRPFAGETVSLMASTNGTDFTEVITAVSDEAGAVSAVVSPAVTTWYRWDFSLSLDYAPASSPRVQVIVKRQPTLTNTASKSTITAGESVTLATQLTDDGSAVGGQPVVLRRSTDGGTTWTDLATVTTTFNGAASTVAQPTVNTAYRWHFLGTDFLEPAQSVRRDVTVLQPAALTATRSPTTIDVGSASVIDGLLTIGGSPAATTPVDLWSSPDGITWSRELTLVTGTDGRVSQAVSPDRTYRYQLRYTATPTTRGAMSAALTVIVRRPTTLSMVANPLALSAGQQTTFSTLLRTDGIAQSGRPVHLDQSPDGVTWTRIVTLTTDSNGGASYSLRPSATATYRWRHEASTTISGSVSTPTTVTVTNPTSLTIDADADGVLAGGSTMIRTVLRSHTTGLPDQTVILRASTDRGTTWIDVGSTVTGATGNAALSVSPTTETMYRWRFARNAPYAASQSPTTTVVINPPPVSTALANVVDDNTLYVGQRTTVRTTLTADGQPKLNRTVELQVSTDGGATWTPVSSRLTDTSGQAAVSVAPTVTSRYRWRFTGAANLRPSASVARTITVSPLAVSALTNTAAETLIDAGERARLETQLTADGIPVPQAAVTLQQTPAGTTDWQPVASFLTPADGRVSASVPQTTNTSYRWVHAGSESRTRAVSPVVVVRSRFVVTLRVTSAPAHAGERVFLAGTVSRHTGEPVRLLHQTPTGAVELARATVRTDGTFLITATLPTAGSYALFAAVGPDARNALGRSPTLTVDVPP